MQYRTDIDGLRALAVTAVIIFHLGFLKNGYLGVDIFFVISGYLITGIIYNETLQHKFTLRKFYERRIRRILPLLFTCSLIVLPIGTALMLPQDLYGLGRAVIASNLSVNNVLMYITSGGYWEPINDYKPMMHTWSLGIEEQFYIIYPLLFLFFRKNTKLIGIAIAVLTILSLFLFLYSQNPIAKFFLLQYRFFELSVGGLGAIYLSNFKISAEKASVMLIISVTIIISSLLDLFSLSNDIYILIITLFTTVLLLHGQHLTGIKNWYSALFENRVVLFLGKISFSLYMWHQIVFAFARMTVARELTVGWGIIFSFVTLLLSLLSYHFIENYFRDRKKISFKKAVTVIALLFISSNAFAAYILARKGVLKDYPALEIVQSNIKTSLLSDEGKNYSLSYNNRINGYNKPFQTSKTHILFLGDSYVRDAANIFLESNSSATFEVGYIDIDKLIANDTNIKLIRNMDRLVLSFDTYESKNILQKLEHLSGKRIQLQNVMVFGPKKFGYNHHPGFDYFQSQLLPQQKDYYTPIGDAMLGVNEEMKNEWGTNYIDVMKPLESADGKMIRLYTNDNKLISFDTGHLTQAGAKLYAKIFEQQIRNFVAAGISGNQVDNFLNK